MKNMKTNKKCTLLCMILCVAMIFSLTSCESTQPSGALTAANVTERFGDGVKVASGAVKIVDLRGSWREMGRQYGSLMKAELNEVYSFTAEIANISDENKEKAKQITDVQAGQSTYTVREFMAGAAETSGLSEEQLQTANAVERIAGLPQCSAAIAWNDYTNGKLVFGRNYDYGDIFSKLSNDIAVTVYHPADGSLATATIGYVGEIYAVNALNEKGIFMELNNGKASANVKSPDSRLTGTSVLFDMMFEAYSLDFTDMFFNTNMCSSSYIINMADSETVRSYEWCPTGVKHGEGALDDGLLVSTNHYVNSEWEFETPTDENSWQSITRYGNLVKLCNAYKGQLDCAKMMEIIGTSLENGGAMNELTVYQLVVEPETLTLWLKVVNASDWTQIDMSSFLLSK